MLEIIRDRKTNYINIILSKRFLNSWIHVRLIKTIIVLRMGNFTFTIVLLKKL